MKKKTAQKLNSIVVLDELTTKLRILKYPAGLSELNINAQNLLFYLQLSRLEYYLK